MTNSDFEKMNLSYRKNAEVILDANQPIILNLDGRGFSKFTKQFKRPFDDLFMQLMDRVASHLVSKIQNAVIAYVQSDEISIYIKPCGSTEFGWFGNRMSKMCSIAAGMASSKLTELYLYYLKENDPEKYSERDAVLSNSIGFDCRAWNVPDMGCVKDWFVYRNTDCIRNSIQQYASEYLSYSELHRLNTIEMIEAVIDKCGPEHDWDNLELKYKYGRYVKRALVNKGGDVIRSVYEVNAIPDPNYIRNNFNTLIEEL